MQTIGLYIHTPFCIRKCPYCDFYSAPPRSEEELDRYVQGILTALESWSRRYPCTADTLYFGGGTPSLLGGERLAAVIRRADELFSLRKHDPEITLEANPADDLADTLAAFAAAGGNRLSLGMQSAVPAELTALGRRHTPDDVRRTVADARRAGIRNISLDLMLGVSGQTEQSALYSADLAAALGAEHISAYLLKLEPNTPYGHRPPPLPDEDATADLYLSVMEHLDTLGYHQYEISNTAKAGRESRHNLKYWSEQPYLGIGPAASSCLGGRRFTYPRDTAYFLAGGDPTEDPADGPAVDSPEEYALLRLRLADGLTAADYRHRFGADLPAAWVANARSLPAHLVITDETGIRLTREGFLLSNSLICHILAE